MADAIGRREPLPSLGHLDLEKVKRETSGYGHNHSSTMNMPAPPLTSPSTTTTYSGPPPPYSYPSSASSSVVGGNNGPPTGHLHGTFAPPQRRQSFGDDKDKTHRTIEPPSKFTLPPLNEAISVSSLLNNTTAPPRPPITAVSPRSPVHRTSVDYFNRPRRESHRHSPSREIRPHEKRPAMNSFSPDLINNYHTTPNFSSNSYHSVPTSQSLHNLADHASMYPRPSALNLSQPDQRSPITTQAPPSAKHVTPPYQQQPAYSYPRPTPGVSTYQQPCYDGWRNGVTAEQQRDEEIRKAIPKHSPPNKHAYGEFVKRHLDIFDIETSLNEIAEGSGQALKFANQYSALAHQHQRSGPTTTSLPRLEDCDHMLRQQEGVMESMRRIRDLIFRQQVALQEQRKYDEQQFNASTTQLEQESHSFIDRGEGSGGFAGSDPKKRRGRAAPPGRCHSCNRAETPEWRRGPDGARTLCNACGLHYAKVTRKMGNKGAPGLPGSSNLRPKDDPSSP